MLNTELQLPSELWNIILIFSDSKGSKNFIYVCHLYKLMNASDLININKGLAEVVIDSVLDDGLLKDIPIVNIIVGLGNFVSGDIKIKTKWCFFI